MHRLLIPTALLLLCGCALSPEQIRERRERLFAEADTLREDKRHEDEREVYDQLIRYDEADARAHFRRGTTYMRQGIAVQRDRLGDAAKSEARALYKLAIGSLDEAIKLQTQIYASAYFCRGECNRELYLLGLGIDADDKYLRRAMSDYRQATEINRLHPQANKALGYLCHFVVQAPGARRKAITYYKRHLQAVGVDSTVEMWLKKLIDEFGDPDPPPAESATPAPKPAPEPEPAPGKVPGKAEPMPTDPPSLPRGD